MEKNDRRALRARKSVPCSLQDEPRHKHATDYAYINLEQRPWDDAGGVMTVWRARTLRN